MHSARVAHGSGSAHVHSACVAHGHARRGLCVQRVACACRAGLGLRGPRRRGAAWHTPERSPLPGTRRGVAGGDATAAEAAQTVAVEHPRQ
jgi:hypothetical protein